MLHQIFGSELLLFVLRNEADQEYLDYLYRLSEKYYNDCLKIIIKSGLTIEKDKLLGLLSTTKDTEERKKLMLEIQNIIIKEKTIK